MNLKTQLHISSNRVLREEVTPVQTYESAIIKKPKPGTGFWTSTYDAEEHTSDWVEWCRGNEFGTPYLDNWFLLTPKPDTTLYIIDSERDLEQLLQDYQWLDPFYLKRGLDAYSLRFAVGIDFEKLARDYDGLHLTQHANNQLHLNIMGTFDLNAWDCESTVWFRWAFSAVEEIATPTQPETHAQP